MLRASRPVRRREFLDEELSLGGAVVLILVYFANLLYTLSTHRDVFEFRRSDEEQHETPWPIWQSLAVLLLGTAFTALDAELVSGALGQTASQLGISRFFLGFGRTLRYEISLRGNGCHLPFPRCSGWRRVSGLIMRAFTTYEAHTPSRGAASDPSAWSARFPILGLTLAGLGIASYLAAYQLGIVPAIWEPFFGDGSSQVLHSFISRMLPVPDAGLGTAGYFGELVAGLIGGSNRWRKMPWMVALYGAIVALVSVTAIGLACVQLFVIRHGCTLCLTSAAISLVIAWLARHELFASLASLKERRDQDH